MSFAVQEQLLLALLFDKPLRDRYLADAAGVLANYDLTPEERQDFLVIRTDGLQFDANLRIDLILSQQAKTWPITFALLSSFAGGLTTLNSLVDMDYIRQHPAWRPVHFGQGLRGLLLQQPGVSRQELALVNAVFEAELGMAYTAAALKEEGAAATGAGSLPTGWQNDRVSLAPHTTAAVIPLPYARLKQALCPCEGPSLWHHLLVQPVAEEFRRQLLSRPDVRLLLARACRADNSATDPVIEYVTMEMPEGFAPLFQYVNGENSVAAILAEMHKAGAPAVLLDSIEAGFRQLLERGLLQRL